MDLTAIVTELKQERDRVDRAITLLTDTSSANPASYSRRVSARRITSPRSISRPKFRFSEAARKRMSERMKAQWKNPAIRKRLILNRHPKSKAVRVGS